MINVHSVLEFWLDRQHFGGGDYYGYGRAPFIVHLSPGQHLLELRLVRDVRVFGGETHPEMPVRIDAEIIHDDILIDAQKSIFPDTLDGRLASNYASVPITNPNGVPLRILGVGLLSHHENDWGLVCWSECLRQSFADVLRMRLLLK